MSYCCGVLFEWFLIDDVFDRRTVAEIQRKVIKQSKRNVLSRYLGAKDDKETIAAWKSDLTRILILFNVRSLICLWRLLTARSQTELAVTTHVTVSDIRQDISKIREEIGTGQVRSVSTGHTQPICSGRDAYSFLDTSQVRDLDDNGIHVLTFTFSPPGESPPPPPRVCFGREDLIEKIVTFAENLTPIALIGAGGIGKTSIALTVLHNDRIKQRFDNNRRFVRCDKFPTSATHFLGHLSKVIGAGVENPKDLAPLRPFLLSKEMLIVLDNAESILDPQGTSAQEIYDIVGELSQFNNICLCITSRISTIPPDCETLDIPTLSMEPARNTFYHIYKNHDQPILIDSILEQLGFHPLSLTLLATVAHHNKWDTDQLTREWERQRTRLLCTQHNKSLAATIDLSLASPMFQELGPNARGLLGVIAFFPQGIDVNNLDWLFPTIPTRANIFNIFSILSLTYQSNGLITMLAPLRDHFYPKDPMSSPLLNEVKQCYFSRLLAEVNPGRPGFEETKWITSEDVNVEHLLNVFISIDANSDEVWDACAGFIRHLYRHKPQPIMLGSKVEGMPDDHPFKPECLYWLSQLFFAVGNPIECKRLLTYALKLCRKWGDEFQIAQILVALSNINGLLHLPNEGIQQMEEALGIYKQLGDRSGQGLCLRQLALLYGKNDPDAAEEAASQAINLLSGEDNQFEVCQCYRVLGSISCSKGNMEKAISHYEAALGIASSFNWHPQQFWIHRSLADIFFAQGRVDDAYTQIKHAKSHAINNTYLLGCAMELQARFLYHQHRLEEAKSEVLCAINMFEKLGAAKDTEDCKGLLHEIEARMD